MNNQSCSVYLYMQIRSFTKQQVPFKNINCLSILPFQSFRINLRMTSSAYYGLPKKVTEMSPYCHNMSINFLQIRSRRVCSDNVKLVVNVFATETLEMVILTIELKLRAKRLRICSTIKLPIGQYSTKSTYMVSKLPICSRYTNIICQKCEIMLCLNKKIDCLRTLCK